MSLKRNRSDNLPTQDEVHKRNKSSKNDAKLQPSKPIKPLRKQICVSNTASSAALKVYCFGEGTAGELGFGNVKGAEQAKIPRLNRKLDGIVALTAGGMHAVALNTNGEVLTWGGNDDFALGRPTPEDDSDEDDDAPGLNPKEATPTVVTSISSKRIAQVTAGDSCTFALTHDGLVYGWGTFRNKSGPYGLTLKDGTIVKYQKEPTQVLGLKDITQISAGADFVLALDAYGKVYAWGPSESGETGYRLVERHHDPSEYLLPHLVALPRRLKVVSIHTGLNHSFAIDSLGRVWSWGLNNYGQTGIAKGAGGNQPILQIPQRVTSLATKMKTIAGGAHHSLGIAEDGSCFVWGRIDGGQIGIPLSSLSAEKHSSDIMFDDNKRPRILLQPTSLEIPSCTAIAAGTDHSLAVTESGQAYSWGLNASAQCGQGSEDDIPVAKLIQANSILEERITHATAGGQFSMITAPLECDSTDSQSEDSQNA